MKSQYHIEDTSQIISPALVVFRDLVEENLRMMVAIAGDAQRLRPHCKTHKMREVVQMQLSQGIVKHKCATFAEAEMLATTGVQDFFWPTTSSARISLAPSISVNAFPT